MNKVYDNGGVMLGNIDLVIKEIKRQIESDIDMSDANTEELLKDLEDLKIHIPNVEIVCINYDTGIDYLRDLIEVAIRYDIVRKSGAWFDIIDIETGEILEGKIHGQAAVNEYLLGHSDVLNRVEDLIEKVMSEH